MIPVLGGPEEGGVSWIEPSTEQLAAMEAEYRQRCRQRVRSAVGSLLIGMWCGAVATACAWGLAYCLDCAPMVIGR